MDDLAIFPHIVVQLLPDLPMGKCVEVGLLWMVHIVQIHGFENTDICELDKIFKLTLSGEHSCVRDHSSVHLISYCA
jgi:hypothetical protein